MPPKQRAERLAENLAASLTTVSVFPVDGLSSMLPRIYVLGRSLAGKTHAAVAVIIF